MSEQWFFSTGDDQNVHLQARMEGAGGTVGDAYRKMRPGDRLDNLTYSDLKQAGAGVIRRDPGGLWVITAK